MTKFRVAAIWAICFLTFHSFQYMYPEKLFIVYRDNELKIISGTNKFIHV